MMTPETRICQNCQSNFSIVPEDSAFYERMKVPAPTWCPECRMVRRFLFRNERHLFRNKDAADGGKEVFSGTPPEAPFIMYNHDYWYSDAWDALEYGRDYDFSRPFFEQFHELFLAVPWSARNFLTTTNSDYCEQVSFMKDAYLCFDCDNVEDSAYLVNAGRSKGSFDCLSLFFSEFSYESVMVNKGYRTFFSYGCENCTDVWFSKNCSGCSDCFGCVNLKGKRYYIFNTPYSKEEYAQKLAEFHLGSYGSLVGRRDESHDFWSRFPVRYLDGYRNVGSEGEYLSDTKNVTRSFLVTNTENSKFIQLVFYKCADSYDYTIWGDGASQMYESVCCGLQTDMLKFCFDCWPSCRALEYSISCRNSSNLFGCVGLRNKEYCIFNKQYAKEDYFALRERIVAHMDAAPYLSASGSRYRYGEFFPPEFSQLAYNQSLAQDLLPLTKEDALGKGYRWQDPDPKEYATTLSAADIPDDIKDVKDAILNEVIQCTACKRAYRVIASELSFLRQANLPLPRLCVDCRTDRRFAQLNAPKAYQRKCGCGGERSSNGTYANVSPHVHGAEPCGIPFETSYAPDRPDIVYCERCYQAETA